MRYSILLIAILSIPVLAYSDTIIVPDDYPTIQGAIDSAVNGDVIVVKPGTYVELIDFKGKAITLQSEQGTASTFIDGNQAGSVITCQSGEGPDSVLDGFTITNGKGDPFGGGMYNESSSPMVINCTFSMNTCTFSSHPAGGGMYNGNYSNPTLTNCTFIGNDSHGAGGGMANENSNPTVINCTFSGNKGGGGGMSNSESSPTVIKCIFSENSASTMGGGMGNYGGSPTVINCIFSNNKAGGGSGFPHGGAGMANGGSTPTVINCIFVENKVMAWGNEAWGGGMYNEFSNLTVNNCTFIGNCANFYGLGWGGGIADESSNSTVTNTIFWNNHATYGPEISIESNSSTLTISYCNVENGHSSVYVGPGSTLNWGAGMIDADPLFVDPANDDFHLTFNSPCRGSGDNSAVTELYDFEGDPRIFQGTVDIGADEFHTHLYITGRKTPGGSIQGKFVGLPGTTPVGLFIGSGILPSPLPTMWGDYWLQAPWVLLGPLGSIPTGGVMVLSTTLPSGMTVPADIPMQALIGLNGDSLTNLCVLEVR